MEEDNELRWCNSKTGNKLSYLETLSAQIKFKNGWISQKTWDALEQKLPDMTEEDAKQELIKIEDEIKSSIHFWRACQ